MNWVQKASYLGILIVTFCLTSTSFAQDITNKIGGTGADDEFQVTDSEGSVKLVVQGDGKVGIGTTTPQALFDVTSTSGGILIPRMTKAQRDAITATQIGMLIYQTDNNPGFYFYNGEWLAVGAGILDINTLTDAKTDASSIFLGWDSGLEDDGDNHNVGVGKEALKSNTSGNDNTAVGRYALNSNSLGNNNSVLGRGALYQNTIGSSNVGVGKWTLFTNQTGSYNVAIGAEAGDNYDSKDIVNKSGCVFIGYRAGRNTTQSNRLYIDNSENNTPLIYGEFDNDLLRVNGTFDINNAYQFPTSDGSNEQVLQTNGSGTLTWGDKSATGATNIDGLSDAKSDVSSVFLGSNSGNSDDGNNNNTGVGIEALYSNSGGEHNVAIGRYALHSNTASQNVAIGSSALDQNTTGHHNIGIGRSALYLNTEGCQNTVIGADAGSSCATTTSGCILIGYEAGKTVSSNNRLYIENSSSSSPLIYGEFDNDLLKVNGALELANGTSASSLKFYEPSGNGSNYTQFSSQAQSGDVSYTLPASDGSNGQVLQTNGSGALSWGDKSATGATNINGLSDGKSDGSSVFLGSGSGNSDDGNNNNTGLGIEALYSNTSGEHNVAIGHYALHSNTVSQNVAIGSYALNQNTTGQHNVGIGRSALYPNTEGSQNTVIGADAGNSSGTNVSGCVLIGYQAGKNINSSNKLYIDNSSTSTPLIYGEFDNNKVTINDVLKLAPRLSEPSSPAEGELYVNSSGHHIYCYLNGSWHQLDN